jgi:putative acetyltransferase
MPTHDIRRLRTTDVPVLLGLWERSVRATHDFLSEADIEFYGPLVRDLLSTGTPEFWVASEEGLGPIGFLGVSAHSIEALFLDPDFRGRGWGRRLVEHAQILSGVGLAVDVNEQNVAAPRFYEALGFVPVARSAVDDMGRPHPILHLRRAAPGRAGGDMSTAGGIFEAAE